MLFWVNLIMFFVPETHDDMVRLHFTSSKVKLDGWQLRTDTGERHPLDGDGYLTLTPPAASRTFELIDPQSLSHFLGTWSDFPPSKVHEIIVNHERIWYSQVVSVDRTPQDSFNLAAEVEVIRPGEQPERSVANTSSWLEEQAEVLLQRTNLGGGSPIIRGMSGNRILLMLDGFRINNATFRLGLNQYLNTVPSGHLEQLEVLSGPSSVQYGSDGLGGTVHLRSVSPASLEQSNLAYLGTLTTADGTQAHTLKGNHKFGKVYLSAHFTARDYSDLKAGDPIGEQPATGYEAWEGALSLAMALGDGELRMINNVSHASHVPRTDRVVSGRDLQWDYHPQDFNLHGLRFNAPLNTSLADHLDLGVSYMRQDEGTLRVSARSPSVREETFSRVDTLQLTSTLSKSSAGFDWTYGLDLSSDRLETSGRTVDLDTVTSVSNPGKFPNDSAYDTFGVFAMTARPLGQNFIARAGLRYSSVFLSGTVAEPIGAVNERYDHLTPSLSLSKQGSGYFASISANQGFRAPNLEDALALGPANRGYDVPNPELQPEDVWNYEANLRIQYSGGLLKASIYQAYYRNLVERVRGTWLGSDTINGEPVYYLDNVGKARIEGISLNSSQQLGLNQWLRADATWTYGTQTDLNVPMTRIPPLRGNLTWETQLSALRLAAVFSWARRQDRLSPGDVDDSRIGPDGTAGYEVIHLRSRYEINRRTGVNLSLENLTDKAYKQHGSGIYASGQSLNISVDAHWK